MIFELIFICFGFIFLNMGDDFLTMRVSFVSMGDNFLNMGDRKIWHLRISKHVVYDLKVLDLRLKSPRLTT